MPSIHKLSLVFGLAGVLGAAGCGSVSLTPDGGTGKPDSAGSAGSGGGGSTTGAAGSTTGSGGSTTGAAGSTTGSGGSTTGSGGSTTGAAGSTTGSGGSTGSGGIVGTGTAGAGGAAGSGSDGGTTDGGNSDTIVLSLAVPANKPFCDMSSACSQPTHITILTSAGVVLDISSPECETTCASCRPVLCPEIACLAPHGVAFTGTSLTWDGTTYSMSTCGAGTTCSQAKKAPAGRYVARMCATPGTVTSSDAGLVGTTCTATGPAQCIDVPFDIPGPTPVEGKLK